MSSARKALFRVGMVGAIIGGGYISYDISQNQMPATPINLDALPEDQMPHQVPAAGPVNLICPSDIPLKNCNTSNALGYSQQFNYEPLGNKPVADIMYRALIAREDRRLLDRGNTAADAKGIARAGRYDFVLVVKKLIAKVTHHPPPSGEFQGGSSLPVQYGTWLYGLPKTNPSIGDKLFEIRVAQRMMDDMPGTPIQKDLAIIRGYLDHVDYRSDARGIVMACRQLFNTTPDQLTIGQAALLAGLPRAPGLIPNSQQSMEKTQIAVLDDMLQVGVITKSEHDEWIDHKKHPLNVRPVSATPRVAGMIATNASRIGGQFYLATAIAQANNILRVTTNNPKFDLAKNFIGVKIMASLDETIQQRALSAVQSIGYKAGSPELGLVYVDHTGQIKALVGGRDWKTSEVNFATALRQEGSSLKPVEAGIAYEHGETPATIHPEPPYVDVPHANNGQTWRVWGAECGGQCTDEQFVAKSSNIVATELMMKYGLRPEFDLANALGLHIDTSHIVPSYILGTGLVSSVNLANTFDNMFGNGGRAHEDTYISSISDIQDKIIMQYNPNLGSRVYSLTVAQYVIQSGQAVLQYGTASGNFPLAHRYPRAFAGKTGTTENNADALDTITTCSGTASARVGFLNNNKSTGQMGAQVPTTAIARFFASMPIDPNCDLRPAA